MINLTRITGVMPLCAASIGEPPAALHPGDITLDVNVEVVGDRLDVAVATGGDLIEDLLAGPPLLSVGADLHGTGRRIVRTWSAMARELVSLGVVELLDGAHQAQVALLDQVQHQHPPAGIPPGLRDDQAQVGLEQVVLGRPAVFGDPLKVAALAGTQRPLPAASFSWANSPASIRLASSTSCPALSSGTLHPSRPWAGWPSHRPRGQAHR
jgi:hypothetical protein